MRLYSLAALVVLPFSSICLSYAWAIACGGWPCSFSLRTSSLVFPACFCGSFLMRRSCIFLLSSCSVWGRHLLSLLLGFASVPLPAVFRGVVLPQVTLRGLRNLSGSRCLSCSCGGAMSVGFAVSLVRRLFSALCRAPPPAPAVLRSFPCRRLPFGVSAFFWPRLPALLLRWWRRLGCRPSLVVSVLLLHRLACRCSLGSAPCD